MFTKHFFLAVVLVVTAAIGLHSRSDAQIMELYNDSGTPASYATYGDAWINDIAACVLSGPCDSFRVDSVRFCWYFYNNNTTLKFRIKMYRANASLAYTNCGEGGTCTNAPGTALYSSPVDITTPAQTSGFHWFTYPVGAGVETAGDFIMGIQIRSATPAPSYVWDDNAPTDCCVNYFNWGSWMEQWDAWGPDPSTIGYIMIRAKGHPHGGVCGAKLRLSSHQIFYGHAAIDWDPQGLPLDPEPITDTLVFTNIGAARDTIWDFNSPNPDFTFSAPDTVFLNPGASWSLGIDFQTVTEGWRYSDFTFKNKGANAAGDTVHLSGIGWLGHWLENFYMPDGIVWDPICGPWFVQMDSCTTAAQGAGWSIYQGGYSDQDASAGHYYTDVGCVAVDWIASSPMSNPNNAGVAVEWANHEFYGSLAVYHGFYWTAPDCLFYHLVTQVPITAEGQWEDVGPYYANAPSDSIQLAFLYYGEDADMWHIDDIRADAIPPSPPEITHEHHSDDGPATWINPDCVHLTCQVLDPNNDPFTATLWYRDHAVPGWSSVAMTPVTGCEYMHLYEYTLCDLDVCHTYDYYFYAIDNTGRDSTLPATAPTDYFHVDILDNTQPQMAYDNGTAWYVRYYPDYWEARFAVRFTPASYPYTLGGAMVMLGAAAQNFPDDDHEDIVAELYDDNGVGGKPGTMIGSAYPDNGTSWNEGQDACDDTTFAKWVYIKIDPCVTITDGSFYIAVRNRDGSVSSDKEAFAYDSGPAVSPYRTWIFYADLGQWGLDTLGDASTPPGPSTNLMVRALAYGGYIPTVPESLTVFRYVTPNMSSGIMLRWRHGGVPPDTAWYNIYQATTGSEPNELITSVAWAAADGYPELFLGVHSTVNFRSYDVTDIGHYPMNIAGTFVFDYANPSSDTVFAAWGQGVGMLMAIYPPEPAKYAVAEGPNQIFKCTNQYFLLRNGEPVNVHYIKENTPPGNYTVTATFYNWDGTVQGTETRTVKVTGPPPPGMGPTNGRIVPDMSTLGPVRRTPSGLRTTLMLGEQLTLEEQLMSGIMPKQINRTELVKLARTMEVQRLSRPSWNLK